MTSWNRVQGDINDTVTVRLLGGVTDLTSPVAAVSVAGKVSYNGGAETTLTGTLDAPNRIATIALGTNVGWLATAAAGCWGLRTIVTFSDGSTKTWPEAGLDEIRVGLR